MEEKERESYPIDLTDAGLYLVDSGCKWRQLPHDFPPYSTVHSFYRRARISGLWDKILEHLVKRRQQMPIGLYPCCTDQLQA